jgi:hypothetical protein
MAELREELRAAQQALMDNPKPSAVRQWLRGRAAGAWWICCCCVAPTLEAGHPSLAPFEPPNGRIDTTQTPPPHTPGERGLSATVLRKYGVGCATFAFANDQNHFEDAECVVFPWFTMQVCVCVCVRVCVCVWT